MKIYKRDKLIKKIKKKHIKIIDNGGRLQILGSRYGIRIVIGQHKYQLKDTQEDKKDIEFVSDVLAESLADLIHMYGVL
jgi:hypothetical protein